MSGRTFAMRCPHLDQLRHHLVEAYRAVENSDIFTLAQDDQTPGNKVYLIHTAMARHRQICPICNLTPISSDPISFLYSSK